MRRTISAASSGWLATINPIARLLVPTKPWDSVVSTVQDARLLAGVVAGSKAIHGWRVASAVAQHRPSMGTRRPEAPAAGRAGSVRRSGRPADQASVRWRAQSRELPAAGRARCSRNRRRLPTRPREQAVEQRQQHGSPDCGGYAVHPHSWQHLPDDDVATNWTARPTVWATKMGQATNKPVEDDVGGAVEGRQQEPGKQQRARAVDAQPWSKASVMASTRQAPAKDRTARRRIGQAGRPPLPHQASLEPVEVEHAAGQRADPLPISAVIARPAFPGASIAPAAERATSIRASRAATASRKASPALEPAACNPPQAERIERAPVDGSGNRGADPYAASAGPAAGPDGRDRPGAPTATGRSATSTRPASCRFPGRGQCRGEVDARRPDDQDAQRALGCREERAAAAVLAWTASSISSPTCSRSPARISWTAPRATLATTRPRPTGTMSGGSPGRARRTRDPYGPGDRG